MEKGRRIKVNMDWWGTSKDTYQHQFYPFSRNVWLVDTAKSDVPDIPHSILSFWLLIWTEIKGFKKLKEKAKVKEESKAVNTTTEYPMVCVTMALTQDFN